MPVSVRLDAELESLVQAAAQRTGQSRSDVIRAGVRAYCERVVADGQPSHFDVWGAETGEAESEGPVRSRGRDGERLLRERFRALKVGGRAVRTVNGSEAGGKRAADRG